MIDKLIAGSLVVLTLSGCGGMGPNQATGTVVGGVAGAAIGGAAGRGGGAAIGAVAGGAIGNAIGHQMDVEDRYYGRQ